MQNNKCTCTSAARQDAWRLSGIDRTPWGVIYGYVVCSVCGAEWRSRAKYIRHINGSYEYYQAFQDEDAYVMRNLQTAILKIDDEITALRKKRDRLDKRYRKIKDSK